MFTFRSKFLLSFLACLGISFAIAWVGRGYYETREHLKSRTDSVEKTHQALLLLYQNDSVLVNLEPINPVFFTVGKTRLTEIHRREVEDIKTKLSQLSEETSDDVRARSKLNDIAAQVDIYEQQFTLLFTWQKI